MKKRLAASLAVVALFAGTAVAGAARTQAEPLTIYAAASLTDVFRAYDANERYSFAGSNTLETQIRNGAPADVFASAAPLNTQRLFRQGLVEKPVTFTANRLALIVPKSNPADIHSVYDLRRKPVKLVIAAPAVPVGGYTRTVLRKMGLTSVLSKVVSQESDVRAVTGKVALGQADAGFVYVTDARAVARPGDRDPHSRLGAAARPLRDRGRLEVDEKGGRTGMDHDAAVGEGPGGAQELRLPAAAEGTAVDGAFRAALVLATGAVLLFLLLPVVAVFLRVPPGELVRRARERPPRSTRSASPPRRISIAMAPHPRLRNAGRLLDLDPARDASATSSSRSSSCRSSCRRPSRASASSSRSAAPGCSASEIDALGIDIAFTKVGRRPRRDLRREPVLPPHRRSPRSRPSTRHCPPPRARSARAGAASSSA